MLNDFSNKSDRLKVLILAEQANPEWVSVPLVGWNFVLAISKIADTHLVTNDRNRDAILRSDFPKENVTFIGLGVFDKVLKWIFYKISKRDGGGPVTYTALKVPFYYLYEYYTWKRFKSALKAKQYHIVHRVTPVSPVMGSLMARKCKRLKIPFILGPINGGLPWPKGFPHITEEDKEWVSSVRRLYQLLPFVQSMRRHAAAIMPASGHTWNEIPSKYHSKCFFLPENAIYEKVVNEAIPKEFSFPLRIAFVGRLVPLKGVDLMIKAAASLVWERKVTIDIIGDGPQLRSLENLVMSEQLIGVVNFHGWLPRKDVFSVLQKAHIFGFPSIREFGGGALIEAMALGLVSVVLDYGGPAEIVTSDTGFIVPIESSEQVIKDLEKTFRYIVQHAQDMKKVSERAKQRIREHYTWESRSKALYEIYKYVLGESSKKPDLFPPERR